MIAFWIWLVVALGIWWKSLPWFYQELRGGTPEWVDHLLAFIGALIFAAMWPLMLLSIVVAIFVRWRVSES